MSGLDKDWLKEEMARARKRLSLLPKCYRPVVDKPRTTRPEVADERP